MKRIPRLRMLKTCARFFAVLIIIGAVICISNHAAYAQNKNFIELTKPDSSSYPDLSIFFRIYNDSGAFARNIDLSAVHVVENDQLITPDSLVMLEPGVRLVAAINEGPTLANRYAQVSRIDKVKSALLAWAQAQPITSMSDFSFVTNSEVLLSHSFKPSDWLETIQNYQPELKKTKPGLTSLSSAIDQAAQSNETHAKTSAVLYVTSLPAEDQIAGLEDLISRAKLGNIRLFIWLVGPQTYATDDLAAPLIRAAKETGGEFVIFSGEEELPDLEEYFDPLTYLYQAVYHSNIKSSGDFVMSLRVNLGQTLLESDALAFTLNVLPPNPIFLSPPARIERSWTETERKKDSVLTPVKVPLEIMIEFPDGLERDLVYSRLFVDNKLADENTTAPFDNFEWDISSLSESGTHVISVSIEDSAGFIVETLELPVEVIVQPKPQNWIEKIFSSFSAPTIGLFFVIASAGVLLVLFAVRTLKTNQKIKKNISHRLEDPLTQPVIIENEIIHPRTRSENQDQWPHIPGTGLAPARLLLQSKSESGSGYPAEIPIGDQDVSFGSDEKKSKITLRSVTVSPLHARITRENQDQFKIHDEGSGSGTWLNYTPVSQYGARLEHGDLVQFGTIAYRFEIYGSQPRKIRVESI